MDEHPNAAIVRSAYEAMARGDMPAMAEVLDEDIIWHESTPGFEGDYRGRDQVLALMGRVMQETGVEMTGMTIHDVLGSDDHTVILHEATLTKAAAPSSPSTSTSTTSGTEGRPSTGIWPSTRKPTKSSLPVEIVADHRGPA